MLRLAIFLPFFLFYTLSSYGQNNEVRFLIDTAITIMRENSVNASQVDWVKVRETAFEKAKGIDNPYSLGSVMRYLYQSVDDFHGIFFYKDSGFNWQKKKNIVSDSIMNEWKKGPAIRKKMLEGNIGYLRIPSMLAGSIAEFSKKAQSLNDSLCQLLNQSPKGLILDLRLNGGGAMHPMILGVHNLLPSGKVGEFNVKKKEDWLLKNNSFLVDTAVLATIVPRCTNRAQQLPVVILTSPQTGSSGEFLIMTFKGRRNTILLSSTTAGYVTVNSGFLISDTAYMNLAVGYGADKNGTVYKEALNPDVFVEGPDSFNDIDKDMKVQAAIKWLKKH